MSKEKEKLKDEETPAILKLDEQIDFPALTLVPTIDVEKFNVTVSYHYAQAVHYGGSKVTAELVNADKDVLKINDALLPLSPTSVFSDIVPFSIGSFNLRIAPGFTKKIKEELQNRSTISSIKIDMYNGIAAIDLFDRGYIYYSDKGYYANYHVIGHGFGKSSEEFGLILESPPRMVTLLMKGLVFVENLQQGFLKFRTSSFDKGYVAQLFPAAILEITQLTDEVLLLEKTYPLKQVKDHKTKEHKMKESSKEINHHEVDELITNPSSSSSSSSSSLSSSSTCTLSEAQSLEITTQESTVSLIGEETSYFVV